MTDPVDSKCRLPTKVLGKELRKAFLEIQNQANFEFRKQRLQQEHSDWFELQNKHFEENGLWCEGLVPWMGSSVDSLAAG